MNILFISKLTGSQYGGPNYSVPSQIKAQSSYDNVFWWNISEPVLDEWASLPFFHNKKDISSIDIKEVMIRFSPIDLVVFEDFYYIDYCRLGRQCEELLIPYIIVPRGSLTRKAQRIKIFKKIVGNAVLFSHFAKKALAIQYLNEKEKNSSGKKWNNKSIVIPNGFDSMPFLERKINFNNICGVFVGRFMKAKGIDILIKAIIKEKELLAQKHISIHLYGPKHYKLWISIKKAIMDNMIGDVVCLHDAVVGQEKAEVLKRADFFVLPSRLEGMPMGLVEALSYSLPCLVTEGTNMGDEIKNEKAGWSCKTTVEGLSFAIRDLCNDIDRFREYSINAHKMSQKYEWSRIGEFAHSQYIKMIDNEVF